MYVIGQTISLISTHVEETKDTNYRNAHEGTRHRTLKIDFRVGNKNTNKKERSEAAASSAGHCWKTMLLDASANSVSNRC